MFEIVAIVTMLGTNEPLQLRLNHPFEALEQCKEFKDSEKFKPIKAQLESGSMFPNVPKEKFATYKFSYDCQEKK